MKIKKKKIEKSKKKILNKKIRPIIIIFIY